VFHPTTFPDPTGEQATRAATLAEITTTLDAAGVSASSLLIAPDDRVLLVLDTPADFLATVLVLGLDPIDSATGTRYAKGLWRGIRVVAAHTPTKSGPGRRG
jgi:hypothetical protein